eukprot:5961237-Pleurochrysis_carterae.AAC.1
MLANRQAKRKAVAAKAADDDPEALFALRRIKALAPLSFRDTLIAHCRSVLGDTELARARARPPATPLWGSDKTRALARRAHHDGFARYRGITMLAGCTTSSYAKKEQTVRHGQASSPRRRSLAHRWLHRLFYSLADVPLRYDEDALHPENGNKARYDPAAAIEQRDRWVAAALEALELEANSERYADELFPEPYHRIRTRKSLLDPKPEVTPRPDTPDNPERSQPAPTRSTEDLSSDVDRSQNAANSSGSAHLHANVWPYVSIVANVIFFTAAITAGMFHALSSEHGGRGNH